MPPLRSATITIATPSPTRATSYRASATGTSVAGRTVIPPLVRPDRQFTFDGKPHWEWLEPKHDRDTISVDRIREDIDGPSHRFLIKRGDTVEVFFAKDKLEIGEVVGISHAEQQVRVRFRDGTEGIWFAVGCIYPACEPAGNSFGHSPIPSSRELFPDARRNAISMQPNALTINRIRCTRFVNTVGCTNLATRRWKTIRRNWLDCWRLATCSFPR